MGIIHNGKMYGLAYKETPRYAAGIFWSDPGLGNINYKDIEPYITPNPSDGKYYIKSESFAPLISKSVWLEPSDGWLKLSDNWPGNTASTEQICFKNNSNVVYTESYRPYVKGSNMCYLSWIDETEGCTGDLIYMSGTSYTFANQSTYIKPKNLMCWVPNGNMVAQFQSNNYCVPNNIILCANNWYDSFSNSKIPSSEPSYNIFMNKELYDALENFDDCKQKWDDYMLSKTHFFDKEDTQWLDIPEDGKYIQLYDNDQIIASLQYWDYSLED